MYAWTPTSETLVLQYTYNYSKDSDAGWNYLLTSIVTQDYINNVTTTETVDYDAIGNPTTYRGATLAFNGRQLTSYTKGSNAISYKYDASGLRASKTVNGGTTVYQYVGDKLYFEQRADGSKIYYFYDSYGNLTHLYYHVGSTKTAYNVVTNSQGDVIAIYNWNGTQLVASYSYDAWGNCTITQDTTGIGALNPIRYRGYYYDSEIGMYYLQSRYYDPSTGRFINSDKPEVLTATPMSVADKNLFAYCDNNPITRIDFDGEFWDTVFDVVSLVVSVAEVIEDPSDPMNWVSLGADVVSLAVPCLTGGGSIVKAATKTDDVVDTAQTLYRAADKANDFENATDATTNIYRSVSNAEAQDIISTGRFNLLPGCMESKQFAFDLEETRQFGHIVDQDTIVRATIPNNMLSKLYTGGVDTTIFQSGTLTVYGDQLDEFNEAVRGTICFIS